MPSPTIGSALHQIQAEQASPDAFGTGQRATALGTEYVIAPSREDRTLFWVTAGGTLAGGPQYGPEAAATDIEVKHLADSGEQVWVYIKNVAGGLIERGERATADAAATPFECKLGAAGGPTIGVAQFDIPDDSCAWVLKSGIGYLWLDATVTVLALLETEAAGVFSPVTTDEATAQAQALEDPGGAGLALGRLFGNLAG